MCEACDDSFLKMQNSALDLILKGDGFVLLSVKHGVGDCTITQGFRMDESLGLDELNTSGRRLTSLAIDLVKQQMAHMGFSTFEEFAEKVQEGEIHEDP